MIKHSIALLIGVVLGSCWIGGTVAQAQQVPEAIQQELDRQGMTVEEARRQAEQMGIDLSNPQQAAQRARELGVPEARIQALLRAYDQSGTEGFSGGEEESAYLRPMLAGNAVVSPDTVLVSELPRTVNVRLRLRSSTLTTEVRPFFISATSMFDFGSLGGGGGGSTRNQSAARDQTYPQTYDAQSRAYWNDQSRGQRDGRRRIDTLWVENVRRVGGTNNEGVWEGRVTLPAGMEAGRMALRVQVTDRDDVTTVLSTNQALEVRSERQDLARRNNTERSSHDSLEYFGYDVFRAVPDAFRPSPVGPVDDGYLVGPNDELRLVAWGAAQFQHELTVDTEGRIYVPDVGQYTVAGKRLDALRRELRGWLSQRYEGLTSEPSTISMDLSVTRMRPVQVYVLGEVQYPGGYTVSSGSTVFNVLYSVGGPMQRGSLRDIRVIRNGEVVATVDLYDYLLGGYDSNEVRLQNNDYIYIPPRNQTVAVRGEVRRPAYYEMKDGETLRDLIDYAGGLKAEAYSRRVHIERVVPFGERTDPSIARRTLDVDLDSLRDRDDTVSLADADFITVPSILDERNRAAATRVNAVKVGGAVYQPGQYELNDSVRTVRDLIEAADGLRGDAYRSQAELIRLQENLDEASRTLDLNAVMEDEPLANVVLRPGDSLYVASVQNLRAERTVRITGQVLRPGTYTYRDSMTVADLLFKGGGLVDDEYRKNVFLERADLFRESPDGRSERVIPFHLGETLRGEGMANRTLRPGDEVRIYPIRVEVLRDRFVEVRGAVKSPGRYAFRDNMTLKDVILQAEGFQEGAFLEAVEVTRHPDDATETSLRARTLQIGLAENGATNRVSFAVDDTVRALEAAGRFQLQHRDRVYVRTDPTFREQETIVVRGEVQFPGEYTLLRENETLSDVISRAGGVRSTGYPKGGRLFRDSSQVIVEMDEAIAGERGSNVILQPGDEIYVPSQPNTVAIRGNVANEGLLKYRPGERVGYYLERAGGTLDDTKQIYLTQASGATFEVDRGWFRRTPRVDDGAVIRVTRKEPEGERGSSVDIASMLTETVSILSSALTVIVLSRRAFD